MSLLTNTLPSQTLKIVTYPDPMLRVPSTKMTNQTEDTIMSWAHGMRTIASNTAMMSNTGWLGIASVQCGLDYSMFITNQSAETIKLPEVFVNPRVVAVDGLQVIDDGCLSIPGWKFKTTRARRIVVKYQDPAGNDCTHETNGMGAAVILHEIDHLNGTLFVDYMPPNYWKKFVKKFGDIVEPPRPNNGDMVKIISDGPGVRKFHAGKMIEVVDNSNLRAIKMKFSNGTVLTMPATQIQSQNNGI